MQILPFINYYYANLKIEPKKAIGSIMFFKNYKSYIYTNSPLARQVIRFACYASAALFIIFSSLNSYNYYKDGQVEIVKEVTSHFSNTKHQLERAIWSVDKDSVQDMLKLFSDNPNVASVWISNSDVEYKVINTGHSNNWMTLDFPIEGAKFGEHKQLGVLKISLSKDRFYSVFRNNIISALIQNLARLLVITICIIWLFNKKLIDPIRKIQFVTNEFNEQHLSPILGSEVGKPVKTNKSEIETLYQDIQLLQENFMAAFMMQKKSEDARIEMEIELEKERQKLVLSQRLETIGQITAQVAHDFGNLIMIINGKTKILDKRLTDEDDLKQTEAIRKATSRAHTLIKKILSMTRMEKAEEILLDPFKSLTDIQDLLKISIGGNISLNIESDGSESMILVESSSFENVIINLCVNARDAMPNGGKIGISINSVVKNNEDFVSISIKDNGDGIPEDIQAKIFDPFFTTKSVGKGTGLGLSQVQNFVKNVGGSLELQSGSNGTCFTLYLPNHLSEKLVFAA
jgi:signal transduction histidine kinase